MKLICQTNIPAERRITKAVVAGGLLSGLLVLFIVPPANLPAPACAFHSITGHSCLTCGMTRSLHAILHGNMAASVRYHPFGPAVFLCLGLSLGVFIVEAVSGRRLALSVDGKLRNRFIGIFAVLWFVYWCVRLVAEFVA
jgi:hypothetical protein